jgi:predicted metal-dependent hydrolase
MFGFGIFHGRHLPKRKDVSENIGGVRAAAPVRVKTHETMILRGREIGFTLTRSRLARNVRLTVNPQKGLEIIVPFRFNAARLPVMIRGKERWIDGHLSKMAESGKKAGSFLQDGSILELFGEPYTLRLMPTIKKAPSVKEGRSLKFGSAHAEFTGMEIYVYSRHLDLGAEAVIKDARPQLEKYFRKKAETYFTRRVPEIAAEMGVSFGRITVRGQQSRWGSCSRENNLNFNWRLIFYGKRVADYVIYHELAHTVHHNHSDRFYALLERFCPDYKILRKKLREATAPL